MKNVITKLRKNGSLQVKTIFTDESMTDQSQADSCDINLILKQYSKTGLWPAKRLDGNYSDLSTAPTFLEAMNIITEAKSAFHAMPSELRNRFENNPQKLLAFLDDSSNREEAISLGLLDRPAPIPTFNINNPSPASPTPTPSDLKPNQTKPNKTGSDPQNNS